LPHNALPLMNLDDILFSNETGIGYPIVRGIPMLRPENALVLSKLTQIPHT